MVNPMSIQNEKTESAGVQYQKELAKESESFGSDLITIEQSEANGYIISLKPTPADAESTYTNMALIMKTLSMQNVRHSVRINPAKWKR